MDCINSGGLLIRISVFFAQQILVKVDYLECTFHSHEQTDQERGVCFVQCEHVRAQRSRV